MKKTKSVSKEANGTQEKEVDVLYQRLGNRWFAFSLVGEEVFVGSLADGELKHQNKPLKTGKKIAGTS